MSEAELEIAMKKAEESERRKLLGKEAEAIEMARGIAEALMEQKAIDRVLTLINVAEYIRVASAQLDNLTIRLTDWHHIQEDHITDLHTTLNSLVTNMKSMVDLLGAMGERDRIAKQKEIEVLDNLNKYLKNWL